MISSLKSRVLIIVAFVALFWGIEAVDLASGHQLDQLGALRPRTSLGLAQIFSAPFLHLGLWHLVSNTLAFVPLAALTLLQGAFWQVMGISMVVGGLGTWLFSLTPSLGFSGVLFGFMGFLLARGLYTRQPLALVLSLVTFSWFSGSVWIGLIPQAGISWAGHFWGFVGGVVSARLLPVPKS
jgi:membrane associated rhomboid family serine protease